MPGSREKGRGDFGGIGKTIVVFGEDQCSALEFLWYIKKFKGSFYEGGLLCFGMQKTDV